MLKSSVPPAIRLRGVRHNNLKNFDLDLPLNRLVVITGLSGSGKSSLAFDTLFAEGQRRYIETFSPYARQFFDRMDKPQVDSIEGIPPAIAIEQRNAVKTTRSTVGTMTEICDYMKMLWAHIARLHCRQCGQPVRKESPRWIWEAIHLRPASPGPANRPLAAGPASVVEPPEQLITFTVPLTEKLSVEECLALVARQGYQRLLLDGQVVRLDALAPGPSGPAARPASLTVLQDRLRPTESNRARFIEACEQAYHFGKGKLTLYELDPESGAPGRARRFSNRLHCAACDLDYREPTPALFSFNHPVGACPACRGFGRIISIDYSLVMPDRSRTLSQCVVRPWQTGTGAESQADLLRACRQFNIPTDVPFEHLPRKWQDFVIEGEPGYGKDEAHHWPRCWYGVKGYFRWLESKAYKMHVRVLLSRYRAYTPCPDCQGKRFQPEALLYRVGAPPGSEDGRTPSAPSLSLADFCQLPIRDALRFIEQIGAQHRVQPADPLGLILGEVRSRLGYLDQVGLSYLTLDRPTRSLSGGETERVNLTTCLGTRLVNTLFVLDEPSVGLHPRDTERLVRIVEQLRDSGNTVVVVEHEASVMRAADQIVDLGPGHGATGGQVVFQGSFRDILDSPASLTGQYLSGRRTIEVPARRPVRTAAAQAPCPRAPGARTGARPSSGAARFPRGSAATMSSAPAWPGVAALDDGRTRAVSSGALVFREASRPFGAEPARCDVLRLSHATRHNLKDLAVEIPLNRFVCVTGVSGSGKTTLVREVLLPALAASLKTQPRAVSSLPQAPRLHLAVKASERFAQEPNGGEENGDSAPGAPPEALLEGAEPLGGVVLVDQSILGKTPRSNPAVYIGAFDDIREVFAQSDAARQRGLNASAFSFNSSQGQCQRCRGAGFEKIEMQFLSDVFIRCPECGGRRYRAHILEVKISPQSTVHSPESTVQSPRSRVQSPEFRSQMSDFKSKNPQSTVQSPHSSFVIRHSSLSIGDLLESTVEEAIQFLSGFAESRPARRAVRGLELLEEVGLGYVRLGQPINTLSGGESQRLKLVRHLAEVEAGPESPAGPAKPNIFLFDEPTTGLHFEDVRLLLRVFGRLVDAGHSVVVIEHNLDVIKCADWLIDLGPEAGDLGGRVVAVGTPEDLAACAQSHTGRALREVLQGKHT